MAHSCRWRFPARPGGSSNLGTGRRAGRIRVTASIRNGTGKHPNTTGLGPGFDAALQVSSVIGCNLQKFRDVLGESSGSSSGEEEAFGGFGTATEHRRIQSPSRTSAVYPTPEKKPRGRPPRALTAQRGVARSTSPSPASPAHGKSEGLAQPAEKVKRLPGRPPGSGEKRRGRPPASGTQRSWQPGSQAAGETDCKEVRQEHGLTAAHRSDTVEDDKDRKGVKRTPLGSVQQQDGDTKLPKVGREFKVTKLKRLREVKLSPLKSRLKAIARKCVPVAGVPRRRRGRPPSAERLRAEAAAAAARASDSEETKPKLFRTRRKTDPHTPQQQSKLRASDEDVSPDIHGDTPPSSPLASASPSKLGRPLGLRTSPRHIKPVRIVPPSKRTDAAIAKQLLQRAKKGAQKKKLLEKEAVTIGGPGAAGVEAGIRRRRRTQLKNIRQFIMPVVSTVSLRIIKTPKRFIEDEGSFGAPHPHMKVARLDTALPNIVAPQPSSAASSPMRGSTAAVTITTSTATTGAAASLDTLPPPPPPAPVAPSSATAVTASLLSPSSTNRPGNERPSNGRFSSSAASCGSSAVSQHSSQLSSGESSRSSSPSQDDSSCDSQASEGTQALSEPEDERDRSPSSQGEREVVLLHSTQPPSPLSEPEPEHEVLIKRGRRGRRGQGMGRGALGARGRGSPATGGKKAIISPATGVLVSNSTLAGSQQASSTASSSSSPPPPPLLSPPQQAPSGPNTAEHHTHSPWIMPHPITPFLQGPGPNIPDKRRSILREPTFRWTSLSRTEQQYFSSAKYAKEGLIRKPIFDNFRPPPLTAQDVGLMPHGAGGTAPAGYPAPGSGGGAGAGTRLFSPLHHHHSQHHASRFETPLQKRSPLLRAPRFTPSEAHSRIFESVTLQSSSGSSPGSLSPLQSSPKSGRTMRRRKRRTFGPLRGQPRSPSHSMTTRSSQPGIPHGKGPSEASALSGCISAGNSSSSLSASALTPAPFSTFSPGALGLSTHGPPSSEGRRAAGNIAGTASVNSASSLSLSSQRCPLFTSSPQETGRGAGKCGRERSSSASRESAPSKEKEREAERSREREKENKRDVRRDWKRSGKVGTPEVSPNTSLFTGEGREGDVSLASHAPKKTPGRKKPVSVDSGTENAPVDRPTVHPSATPILTKGRLSKKGRSLEKGSEAELGEKEEKTSAPAQQTGPLSGPTVSKHPPAVSSLGSMLAQAEKQPVADKRVVGLLKKAKAQLFKIEKSKSLKSPDQPKAQSQESDSSETSVRGPRIKHVCRRAAVALGRNRAVFPDDMPTLSALPWEEREKILSSMGNDDKSSVAGSEEAEPQSPPIKPVTRHTRTIQEGGSAPRKGRRSRRCGQCPGCQVPEDCGVCTNCLDKPKFGGRNIKKQCCKVRKCQNLQWMPSKMLLQKRVKGKKDRKKNKGPSSSEPSVKLAPPPLKEEPTRKKSETPPPKTSEEKQKQQQLLPQSQSLSSEEPTPPNYQPPDTTGCVFTPGPDSTQSPTASSGATGRKERKPQQPTPPSSSSSPQSASSPPAPSSQQLQTQLSPPAAQGTLPTEAKRKPQQQSLSTPVTEFAPEEKHVKKLTPRPVPPSPKPKPKDKHEKALATKPESSTLNLLSTPSTGASPKQRAPCDGVHRIRVDFKMDHDVENTWATGGLSLLTSAPITPRVVCFLCASSGNVEFVFCQVCCEPFHLFCLGETERPLKEQWENWCCLRCRFCHACGRQHQTTKQPLLECDKCRNSYHPECLGPNHPTRPTKKKRVWICTKCVRCNSCGATKPGKAWDARWSHDFSLCHDCAKLFAKGNFCPLCDKCYDDDDYESKMMHCGRCEHWVHARCENLTDEMYELLSKLPESVAYTCTICTERQPAEWRTALEKELQGSVHQVLTALLNSRTTTHLLRYRQAGMKPPELNPETEESLPSRRSPEGPDPPVLTEVTPPNDSPLDLESVEKKMDAGLYKSVLEFSDDMVKIIQTAMNSDGGQPENRKANSMVKSFFIRQMERVFPWFKVKESRFWETHKVSTNSGLLPNAVLPPSLDHNYAQWQKGEEMARAEQPLMKKIIPAPRPKIPGEPDSPTSLPPPPPLLSSPAPLLQDLNREDSPEQLPPPGVTDNRQCVLCLKYGDENTNEGGRLLYIGQNEWTHVNCALWSAEVFEDDDGSLKNVHMAVIRGKQLRCENCQRPGATVGCCLTSCTSNYHFMCARQRHCVFLEDKKVYCQRHRDLIKGEVVSGFEVTRRILVDLDGISLRRKFLNGLEPENVHLMIGSMTIDCLGILTELSDCKHKLFPIGYQCSRVYWSTLDARKRCVYTCRILMCRPAVLETDLKSALTEENRTISHSPPPSPDKALSPVPDPFDSPTPSDRQSLLPSSPQPPKVYTRNRHPSYPPCQRSPGSRPLPSPGGASQSAHEIVTVGDPLLNSGLKSIGSRRHSTSSISPQPRQKVVSPPQAGLASAINQLALFSSTPPSPQSSLSVSRDLSLRDSEKGVPSASIRTLSRSARSLSPGNQHSRHHHSMAEKKADTVKESVLGKQAVGENTKLAAMSPGMRGASQASPQPGTAVLTVHQRGGNSQSEKGKQGGKDPDLSAGITVFSRHRVTTTLTKDRVNSHSVKEGNIASTPIFKDAGKSSSPQPPFHKSSGRKSQDYLSGPAPAAAMKLLWSSGSSAEEEVIKRSSQPSSVVPSSHAPSATKDKHSKVRNVGSREASKEREKTHQNSSKIPMLNNNNTQHEGTGGTTPAQTPATQDSSSKSATISSSKSATLSSSKSVAHGSSKKSAAHGSSNKSAALGSSNKSAALGSSSKSTTLNSSKSTSLGSSKSASLGSSIKSMTLSSNKSVTVGSSKSVTDGSSNKSAAVGSSNKSAAVGSINKSEAVGSSIKSATPGGSNKSATPGGSNKSATPGGSNKSATPGGSKMSATPGGSNKSVTPGGSNKSATPGGSNKSATPGGSNKSATPGGSNKSATPGGSNKSATPGGSNKSATPGGSNKSVTPGGSNKSATPGGSNKSATPGGSNKSMTLCTAKSVTIGNNTKALCKVDGEKLESQGRGERFSKNNDMFSNPEKIIRSSLEANLQAKLVSERNLRPSQVQAKATACEVAAAKDKKRAIVKASLTPLKADPNGTTTVGTSSGSNTTTSICPSSKDRPPNCRSPPSASSESSESDSPPPHPVDCRDEHLLPHCTEDEGTSDRDNHALLEDEGGDVDQHHEDDSDGSGSAKRRYPRRSARARSNMFFGLTPFYGVRSYGEEDIPFYSSSGDGPSKRRPGGSRRSAEGQVDGADDMSTSSSGDSGAEEEGRINQCSNKDPYYYNFTRTIINPGPGLPSIEGIDQCLGRGSQLQRFLKDEEEEEERVATVGNEGVATLSLLGHQQIGQLDGIDDSSESDASASTTTTATAASSHKSTGKRKGRDRHVEKLEHDSGKEADGSSGGGGSGGTSSNNRDGRKSQKDGSLPLVVVKSSQGHDPLEAQLSLSTDLLKSDSDNNNSDDCGNILPSDIMEFVLNTPSMQALGQQTETASSELLSLDEGYGVDVNRRKDILFEDFPQPLPRPEPVESGVTTSISVEEPYGLPLELPSDLSVLTTRSPTVNNQNHAALISEGSERSMLSMATSEETITEKGGEDNQQRSRASISTESQQEGSSGSRESQVTEGHVTPEQFERNNSPTLGQVVEADNQDQTRSSGTPSLPRSPTLPLQGQTYIPAGASASPGPTQMTNATVQATSHLKPGPEKLIVVNQLVNQHLQPLYVVQTLPNGVTQKIHITPSVSSTGVMDTMTLTTGLTTGMTTSQPIFPAGGKVLGSMPHHSQIHTFTSTTQTGFQSGLPSTTSGLLIGVPSHEPQILVTEAGRRHDLSPNVTIVSSTSSISTSSAVFTSGHGKKRPISRLQPRKTKKLARSRSQPTLAPSEMGPNMTLINLSSPQMSQSGLVELGTLTTAATTSHRKVPNIIKRPKSGVVFFEPTTLLQKRLPLPSGQLGILGHDSSTQLLPCTVSGLNPNHSAVLNVVSMAPPNRSGGLVTQGPVSLSNPVLSSAEIARPISNLLFKASPHNLGLPEQQMVVHSGVPQLSGPVQTSIASSICVLPSHQTISMSVSHQVDPESGAFQLQQNPVRRILADKTVPLEATTRETLAPSTVPQESGKGRLVGVLTQSSHSQSSCTTPISRSSSEKKQALKSGVAGLGKGKQKAKRSRQSPDKASGKKHKGWQAEHSWETQGERSTSTPGSRESVSPEVMDTGKPRDRGTNKNAYSAKSAEPPALMSKTNKFSEEKYKTTTGSLLVATSDQEGSQRDSSLESKPKKGLIFEICSDDGFQIRCESIEEAWKSLTDKVQEARSNARLKELSFEGVNGLRMLGVLHDAVVYLLEQLYGSRHCRNYHFRFHKPEEADEPPINPHGSARAELYNRRSVFDMFNFLASKHRQPPEYNPHHEDEEEVPLKSARRATSMDLPMAMRFRHLKRTSKEAVGVYRSAIHGRGLFCKRSIDAGEMVIEYSGNVIRSVLTDKREKFYDSKGVGCYMFRIDDYEVVDATVHGNAARFINHSCEPNCYSRVINVDGQKHIVIFASRKIYRGEELTYDYKFPIEDLGNKLPCNCGAKKCRKFLN